MARNRLILSLGDGLTLHGSAGALRRLIAALRSDGGVGLLREQLTEALQEHESDSEGAADEGGCVHDPIVGRAPGARESAT